MTCSLRNVSTDVYAICFISDSTFRNKGCTCDNSEANGAKAGLINECPISCMDSRSRLPGTKTRFSRRRAGRRDAIGDLPAGRGVKYAGPVVAIKGSGENYVILVAGRHSGEVFPPCHHFREVC